MLDQSQWQQISQWIDRQRDSMTEDLRSLVRIRSVSDSSSPVRPFGPGCREAMRQMLALGEREGFSTVDCDGYVGCVREDERRCDIALWGHLDVVDEGSGWHYPPYEGVIVDGHMIGRGSADNKGALIAALYSLKCLRALGYRRGYTAGVYFGCNEESGMGDLPYFLQRNTPARLNLVVDSGFPVCYGEAGTMNWHMTYDEPLTDQIISFSAGEGPGMVPAVASVTIKGRVSLTPAENISFRYLDGATQIDAAGIAGHPAFPAGTRNALGVLADYLLSQHILTDKDAAKFAFMRQLACDNRGSALHIAREDGISAMLYCTPTMARMENGRVELRVNIRYPAGDPSVTDPTILRHDMLMPGIQRAAQEQGLTLSLLRSSSPILFFPKDHAIVQALNQVYHDAVRDWGQPFILNGGCYAHALPNALGFGPGPLWNKPCTALAPGHGGAHGPDECQSLDAMLDLAKVLAYALLHLDGLPLPAEIKTAHDWWKLGCGD